MNTSEYITPSLRVIPFTPRSRICQGSPTPTSTEAITSIYGGGMDD